jgi:hypothetical protein
MELKRKLQLQNAIPEFDVQHLRDLNYLDPIYARLYITVEERVSHIIAKRKIYCHAIIELIPVL